MSPDATDPTRRYRLTHLTALAAPLAAGLVAFGWRAAVTLLLVVGGAVVGHLLWRNVGRRGRHLRLTRTVLQATLLSALLPAHLAATELVGVEATRDVAMWPALVAAGLIVVAIDWAAGGAAAGARPPPALWAYLILLLALGTAALAPRLVLQRGAAVTGDLLRIDRDAPPDSSLRPWATRPPAERSATADAVVSVAAADRLTRYTRGLDRPADLRGLIRDRLPPMEDLVVLGRPAPLGLAGVAAVAAGGLLLIYRRVTDGRLVLVTLASAYAGFLLLPVPAVVTDAETLWTWAPALRRDGVGWDVALTFVHYQMLAGPVVFASLFLVPLAECRPLEARPRLIYGVLAGSLMAASQLYASVAHGPLAAAFVVALLTPTLDRLTRARTLV